MGQVSLLAIHLHASAVRLSDVNNFQTRRWNSQATYGITGRVADTHAMQRLILLCAGIMRKQELRMYCYLQRRRSSHF